MEMPHIDDPLSGYGIIDHVARMLEGETYITTDVGQHQMRVAQIFPFERPRQWLTSGGLGTMGFGLPAAIGAALEKPNATVVCFSGDGSLLMNIQELITAVEENANVKIVLSNNNSLGLVHQQQDLFYDKRIFASRYIRAVDFATIAKGIPDERLRPGQVHRSGNYTGQSTCSARTCFDQRSDRRSTSRFPHGSSGRRQ